MKYFLNIKDARWVPGSQTKMIYVNENGQEFIGPLINPWMSDILIVEASNIPIDGYYQIIKMVGSFPKKTDTSGSSAKK